MQTRVGYGCYAKRRGLIPLKMLSQTRQCQPPLPPIPRLQVSIGARNRADMQDDVVAEQRHFILVPSSFHLDIHAADSRQMPLESRKEFRRDQQFLFLAHPFVNPPPQFRNGQFRRRLMKLD